jgi:hypothetical protein
MPAIIVPNLADSKPRNFYGLFRIPPSGQVGHFGQVLDNVQNVQNSVATHIATLIAVLTSTDMVGESLRVQRLSRDPVWQSNMLNLQYDASPWEQKSLSAILG